MLKENLTGQFFWKVGTGSGFFFLGGRIRIPLPLDKKALYASVSTRDTLLVLSLLSCEIQIKPHALSYPQRCRSGYFGRIRFRSFWSDPAPFILVGSGSVYFSRIRFRLFWSLLAPFILSDLSPVLFFKYGSESLFDQGPFLLLKILDPNTWI